MSLPLCHSNLPWRWMRVGLTWITCSYLPCTLSFSFLLLVSHKCRQLRVILTNYPSWKLTCDPQNDMHQWVNGGGNGCDGYCFSSFSHRVWWRWRGWRRRRGCARRVGQIRSPTSWESSSRSSPSSTPSSRYRRRRDREGSRRFGSLWRPFLVSLFIGK